MQDLTSIIRLATLLQVAPAEVSRMANEAGLKPTLRLDELSYYSESAAGQILNRCKSRKLGRWSGSDIQS